MTKKWSGSPWITTSTLTTRKSDSAKSILKIIFFMLFAVGGFVVIILAASTFSVYVFPKLEKSNPMHVEEIILYLPNSQNMIFHDVSIVETPGCVKVNMADGQSLKHCGIYQIITQIKAPTPKLNVN